MTVHLQALQGRRLAGALLAPATLVVLNLLHGATSAPLPSDESFSASIFTASLLAYFGSAVVGGMSSAARWVLRAPRRTEVIILLFAVSAAGLALLFVHDAETRPLAGLAAAVASLPVSVAYCVIAGVPVEAQMSIRKRRLRTLAAVILAPASLVLFDLIRNTGYLAMPGHTEKYFPGGIFTVTLYAYAASALVGVLASALRLLARAPLSAGVISLFFSLSAALLGLLVDVQWMYRPLIALAAAAASLPVSLTYCAIAGVRWRSVGDQ